MQTGAVNLTTSGPPSDVERQFRIGIITHDFESPYYCLMVDSAVKALRKRGHNSIVQSNAGSRKGEMSAWHSLMECDCDGIILQANLLTDQDLDQMMERYPSTILIKRSLQRFPNRSVCLDNRSGGAQAAVHLIENGHRLIAMATGPLTHFEVVDRRNGFINALNDADCDMTLVIEIESDFNAESGAAAMNQIIHHDESVTAVFFHSDDMAIGALDWCRRHGIRVPQDVSIIGFDNLIVSQYTTPRLTTIGQPVGEIGEAAVVQLISLLTNNEKAETTQDKTQFTPRLNNRSSVARLSPDNAEKYGDIASVSSREKSCIYWAAKGKTSWEISIILEVSESTIVFHLRNAGKKLNTVNRTHTVAEAIRRGVISL